MANRFDLNNRTSRLKVAAAGFDQFDALAVSVIIVRFFIYLIAAAFIHDYSEKFVIASAATEIACMAFILVLTFKRDIIANVVLRLIGQVLLAGAAIGVIYVNGIISTYLHDVQKRESVIVLLVIFNILFVIVEAAVTLMSLDIFLAASTSRHRKSRAGEFKTRVRPMVHLVTTILCFAVLALPAVLSGVIVSGLDSVKVDTRIYQVVKSEYVYYDYPTTIRKQGSGCVLTDKNDDEVMLAETPLYFGDGLNTEKILLPRTYAIIQPAISSTKRVDNLSLITNEGGSFNISSESGEREASDFFLYDGKDTYVFFEETKVTIGEMNFTVSPFSYLTAVSNGSLMVFDPITDSCSVYSLIGRDAVAIMKDGTKVDLGTNILMKTDGTEQMLFVNPSNLSEYVN
ncbi:MAG: hypothetical protein K6F93_06995 [Lachnospiraceae bacterium]|nr:hypothetical protein [Lachnospiraceae bacterium]